MPAAIDTHVKKQVINQWLSGDSRDRITADNHIGAGTVSNIINEWKKGVEDSDYEWVRELTVPLRKQGIGLNELAPSVRLHKYIKKFGADEDQIESFIANCMNGANSLPSDKIIDLTNQLFDIAKSESFPPAEVPIYINHKLEEKQRLEEQIQQAGALLQSKNVDIETINEFNQLKEKLSKHNLSLEDPTRLSSILQTISQIGYEPRKIVAAFASMKSLRQKERQLKNNCKMFESRMARCREVLPSWEQVVRLGIGVPELLALHNVVLKKADKENLAIGTAAYRVMEDIEDYNKLGDMKKQLYDVAMQIQMMNQISARQNNAVMAVLKLQSLWVTEDQIIHLHKYLETNSTLFDGTVKGRML